MEVSVRSFFAGGDRDNSLAVSRRDAGEVDPMRVRERSFFAEGEVGRSSGTSWMVLCAKNRPAGTINRLCLVHSPSEIRPW